MRTKYSNKPVDRELYQKARDEVLTKLSIPQYFHDNIDANINLTIKPNCLCPFHEEDTPSFRYNGNDNYWRCFGKCQDGGTVVELHMRKYGIKNHYEGIWHLREIFGKKYGLSFKNFFLTEDNTDISIDHIIKKSKPAMTMEEFLKPVKTSKTSIVTKIETKLVQLHRKDKNKYIEACIMYDNFHVYGITDIEKYKEFLNQLSKL